MLCFFPPPARPFFQAARLGLEQTLMALPCVAYALLGA